MFIDVLKIQVSVRNFVVLVIDAKIRAFIGVYRLFRAKRI